MLGLGEMLERIKYFAVDELCKALDDDKPSSLKHLFMLLDESTEETNQRDLFLLFTQNERSLVTTKNHTK